MRVKKVWLPLLLLLVALIPQWRWAAPALVGTPGLAGEGILQIPRPGDAALLNTRPFCQRWSAADAHNRSLRPFDRWFTHHPSWIVANETDDRFCVQPGNENDPLLRGMIGLYANQFFSSCKKVHMRYMWSSGWGADFLNMQGGLVGGLRERLPFVVEFPDRARPWHYTANKRDHSNLTCAAGDTTCYFLPYHGCPSPEELRNATDVEIVEGEIGDLVNIDRKEGMEAYSFMTRKQLWLRRAVFDYKQQFKAKMGIGPDLSDCTVMHVRRSDVILHGLGLARRYFPVSDYVQLIPDERLNDPNHYIFLLTDDQNAIDEAHEFFPEMNWKYFDRKRHRGSEGGWENQTPSQNPAQEVVALLATFDLAQSCSAIVHGKSNLADIIYQHLRLSKKHTSIERYRVEGNRTAGSESNKGSEVDLQQSLARMRMEQNGTVLPPSDEPRSEEKSNDVINTKLVSATEEEGWKTRKKANQTHCSDTDFGRRGGIIVVNLLGLLANNLFEAGFAKRMAAQLGCGWHVIYRTAWNPAFLTPETDRCFPNALAINSNRLQNSSVQLDALLRITDTGEANATLIQALNYNELEPEKHPGWNNARANEMVTSWIDSLGERALTVEHLAYDLKEDKVDRLVSQLQDPNSMVRVLNLRAFFIHYDWMRDWMDEISEWLQVDPSCCTTSIESIKETIVIHIRDFEPEDNGKNKNLQVGVYRDIIEKYSTSSKDERQVVVVCQPKSVNTTIVQDLVTEFRAVVHTGESNVDAFCILKSARGIIIPSTSSSFSQLAALLAEHENENVQVSYPTHTLDFPKVTMKVPTWKYHLTNSNNTGIAEFDVDHERLKVDQAR